MYAIGFSVVVVVVVAVFVGWKNYIFVAFIYLSRGGGGAIFRKITLECKFEVCRVYAKLDGN